MLRSWGIRFANKFGLDSRPPKVGDEVVSLGFSKMKIIKQEVSEDREKRYFEMVRKTEMRIGKVTGVYQKGQRQIQWPFFETNIPIEAGMSGGPVFLVNQEDGNINACAVISKDFSPKEAFGNFMVPGVSKMAMIWPAVVLPFKIITDMGATESESSLLDLINKGIIKDIGEADKKTACKLNDDNTFTITRIEDLLMEKEKNL